MIINIDESAGFCWGVVRTVDIAEKILKENKNVYILGQIIHNPKESERLAELGLKTIYIDDFERLANSNAVVIIRAHGEPPSTYQKAKKNKIIIIDATCPLVRALQKRVAKYYSLGYQIVILGKKDHAEVIGLRGVCQDQCIVVNSVDDAVNNIDFSKKTVLLSQTTKDKSTFYLIKEELEKRFEALNDNQKNNFIANDTICKYVANREDSLRLFAKENDIVVFVAGKNSSNANMLFKICSQTNSNSFFIEDYNEIDFQWFDNCSTIGITGATSTPQWFLQYIKSKLELHFES